MPRKECAQCVEHAELHSGNWGFGPQNEPCPACKRNRRKHAAGHKVRA
ncbi:hypothetical protein O3Q52_20095 [Streptomyces sp. ActVer]|nr:hypothetical protein [Streptomyces sp. ActVer]MCZ4510449.1 hypothetical protein [Streptomyces sp. ActVer]